VGARVGRSIALSSSQTQHHNITRDSLNQGVCRVARPASGQPEIGPVVLPSRPNGCGVAAKTFTVEQLPSEHRTYDPFLIVSCADDSYYIEVWGESEFERWTAPGTQFAAMCSFRSLIRPESRRSLHASRQN